MTSHRSKCTSAVMNLGRKSFSKVSNKKTRQTDDKLKKKIVSSLFLRFHGWSFPLSRFQRQKEDLVKGEKEHKFRLAAKIMAAEPSRGIVFDASASQ